jgi:alkanesulfonate monooxygenase SsuD/methylene tetrahydromethanopterin reductase-like flavin-dependent oxidoreductase (luciferase family)
MIDALRALAGPNPVTYRDSQIVIQEALISPKPVTRIPTILGGGRSRRVIRRIAEAAEAAEAG